MSDETKQAESQPTEKQEQAQEASQEPKATLTKEQEEFVSKIESMSVLELSTLVKVLEDKFGVSAQAPMMVASAGPGAGAAAAEEEKSTFDVVLADIGPNKIQVIKEIRVVTSLGLKEAKDLVEAAPKAIKEGLPKKEAEEVKAKIEATGAKVELK
ncbi:50S ribosomal protein L7/L12 [Candidatus Omnitrophota bacterium]